MRVWKNCKNRIRRFSWSTSANKPSCPLSLVLTENSIRGGVGECEASILVVGFAARAENVFRWAYETGRLGLFCVYSAWPVHSAIGRCGSMGVKPLSGRPRVAMVQAADLRNRSHRKIKGSELFSK